MHNVATGAPMARRLIDLTEDDLDAKLSAFAISTESPREQVDPDGAMTRTRAASFLEISLSKLDVLSRREHDPLIFYYVGESRRYLRADLLAWLKRQQGVGA
jgi:hypothetical protein